MKVVFSKLRDISLSITDGVHNTIIDDVNGDCFLLSAKNIKNGVVNFDNTDRRINNDVREKLNKRTKMSFGDVLFTTVGTLGEIALADDNCNKYEFQRSVAIIKPNEKRINNKYLYYLLKSDSYNYYFKSIATGAAQPCIFIGNLANTKIEYFEDIDYQKRVADILSAYDYLIFKNNCRIKILEKMAQELYKEWFVRFRFPGYETSKFENGLPDGWSYVKLGQYANISTGKCNREDAEDNGIYPLFDRSQEVKRSSNWIKDCEAIIVPGEGTRFIPRYFKGKFNLHQRCYCVEPKLSKIGKFLYHTILLNRIYFLYVATGATVPSLRQNNFTNMKFIMPKLELVNKFDEIVSRFFEEIHLLKDTNENLAKQRDLLLPRLMSGKLEV